MRLNKSDLWQMLAITLMSAPPIAYMSFDFMFPNLTPFSTGKNLLVILAISFLTGMPSGYFIRRTDLSLLTTILYTGSGYALAVLMYSGPYTFYHADMVLPSLYYALFFRFTIILLFFYMIGGFVGAIFGQMVREAIGREETSTSFAEKPGA